VDDNQDCGVRVARSQEFLGGVRFLRTLGVGFFLSSTGSSIVFNHLMK